MSSSTFRVGDACAAGSLHVVASVARRDGGSTTAVLNTVRALRAAGHHTLIVSTTADGALGRLTRSTAAPVPELGVPVWFCRRSRPMLLKHSWQQAARLLRHAHRYEILHVHGVYLANSVWAYLACRLSGTPYVVQPHGTLEPYQESRSRLRKRVFNSLIGRRILAGASALVATSSAEAANLAATHPEAAVHVVPLGATAVSPAAPPSVPPNHPWVLLPRDQRVVFIGRLAAKKRPDLLLDAWNGLDLPAHLLLAGPEEDWTWHQLQSRSSVGRRGSVGYAGSLNEAEVAWVLERAGLLVLPSENENFGLVVTEAMSHGCAVLTTRQTAAGEHVEACGGGVVLDQPDASELVGALRGMLGDPRGLARMGRAAQEHAGAQLTWEASARRLLEVYAACTSSRSTPSGNDAIPPLRRSAHMDLPHQVEFPSRPAR